jgi:hypothetical protein
LVGYISSKLTGEPFNGRIAYLPDMEREVANLSYAEATGRLPVLHYARCVDNGNRPANHVGDWPEQDQLYAVRLVPSKTEGIDLVHVLSFQGEAPYFNAFGPHRFELVAELWLN